MTELRLPGLVTAASGYHHVLDRNAVHYGVPSCAATVIIAFDEPLDVGWTSARPNGGRDRFWLLACGLHTEPALIRTHGLQHGIQLSLTPCGCRSLFGLPMGALSHELVHHSELPRGLASATHERTAQARGWRERYAVLTDALRSMYSENATIAPELDRAWQLIADRHGQLRVDDLAAEVGWSRRHLATKFAAEFGVTPKEAARLRRFEYSQTIARTGESLADTAALAGYADQAHLTREWRAFTGRPPRRHLADQFPILDRSISVPKSSRPSTRGRGSIVA